VGTRPEPNILKVITNNVKIERLAARILRLSDPVKIESSHSSGWLKFSDPKLSGVNYPVEYLRISLKGKEIADSSMRVYHY
jgi:hypothetical protein